MRSRSNYQSSQTKIRISPQSLRNGPLDNTYHSNQLQPVSTKHETESFETPPRYKRYSGPGPSKRSKNNDYNQGGNGNGNGQYETKRNLDFKQKQNQNQNQNQNRSNLNNINNNNNNNCHKYKQQNKPNMNEDTKATLTPKQTPKSYRNENDRQRQRERVSPHSQRSNSSRYSYHESETKWDNDRHQDQDKENQNKNQNKNRNTNNNNPSISDNKKSYQYNSNSRQNQYHQNRDSDRVRQRQRQRQREEHNYDEDVADNDYHALEKWDPEYDDTDVSNNQFRDYPYHKHSNQNGKGYREREYERDYDRDYDSYDRRDNQRGFRGFRSFHSYRDSHSHRDREYNNDSSTTVCKFYNPYFKTGCKNKICPYAHLKPDEFPIYVKFIRRQNEIDSFSQKKYDDALAYIKQGLPTKAFCIFRHLVSAYEYDAHCNFWLGRCYQLFERKTREDLQCAKYYYQRAISLKPNHASFHAHYAEFMVEVGRIQRAKIESYEYKQAKIHCLKALELKPSARFYLQYAKLLDEIEGEFFEAKKYYKLALETYGSDTRIRLNYARLLHKMGNLRASKQEFGIIFAKLEKYRSLDSKWLWPHFHYAKLLVDMNYYESAKKEFQLCIDIQEHHNNKFFSEIYYEFSKLLFNAFNDNDHAYYYINSAVSQAPHKHYYKKLLYRIQDAYYQRNQDNQDQDNNTQQTGHQQEEQSENAPGFGFGDQYDYGLPEDEDCAASMGKLSLSSCTFGGMNQKETRPKTPTNKFIENIKESKNDESQNNNEASLEIPMNPEIPEMENRFCATEFDRFISSDTLFGNELEKYCDKFEDEGVNDIRWLLNENAMDENFLQTKIKMNKESIILWKKRVNIFRNQYNIYTQWLQRNNFKRTYFGKFQVYGILNLESFFYYIKNKEDVLYMIGNENKRDADFIWRSAQKEYSQTKDEPYL